MFISFAGIDGCGKTTQASLLTQALKKKNHMPPIHQVHGFKPAVYSNELKKIANIYCADFHQLFSNDIRTMSFVMDLMMLTQNVIIPALKKNEIVITEKYYLDTIVYAPLLGSSPSLFQQLESCILKPDLYLILDISAEESVKRIHSRSLTNGLDIAPKENIKTATIAKDKFLNHAKNNTACCQVFNAQTNIEELHTEILNYIESRL